MPYNLQYMIGMAFHGLTRGAFKHARHKFDIVDSTNVHHIIPRQWRDHAVIRSCDFNIHGGQNLMLMPTRLGKQRLITTRPCHEGGHMAYNLYVRERLDTLPLGQPQQLEALVYELRQRTRVNCVPW